MKAETQDTAHLVERLERQLLEATAALEQARQELAQRERLAQLGQMSVSISHELRQPLSVINNIAYYLRLVCAEKGSSADAPAALRRHLDKLEHQAALASRIICSLTEYAQTQQPSRRPTDLNQAIEKQTARLEIPETTGLEKHLAPKLAAALADPLHLERILHNLLTNAVQSMGTAGGALCLRTFAEDAGVVLEVSDTGSGIPEELHEKLFQPFFSTKSSSLGLGLALSRQLVEANQGSIRVRSQPGCGATFQVRLPAA